METALPYISQLLSNTILTVFESLAHNAIPLSAAIIIAVLMKVYVNTEKLSKMLVKKSKVSIIASVLFGTFTPFCACGTTAVILGMLASELPWGPVMAFLTSSPLMDPGGFFIIAGVISLRFAIVLTVSSLLIGLISGFATHRIEKKTNWLKNQNRFTSVANNSVEVVKCGCSTTDKNSILRRIHAPAVLKRHRLLADALPMKLFLRLYLNAAVPCRSRWQ